MRVYVYPADTQGCGTVRLIWAANHLRSLGHAVTIIEPTANKGIEGDIDSRTDTLVNVRIPEDADVIVLQRVLLKYVADMIPHIRASGRAVVVDMDDDLTRIDPANPAFLAMHPSHARDPKRHWGHATRACEAATLVTLSTPALASTYANHGRFEVIRNAVPRGFLGIEHFDSDVVGWGGSMHSHPRDMQPVGSAIAQLTRDGSVDFCVVGPGVGVKQALGLDREPLSTGPVDIKDWPIALAQNIGIGIAPLADTQFNAAKSWLKILEYSSLGIPWVASPCAEYLLFGQQTLAGYLAWRPKDWLKRLRELVGSEWLREEMGGRGRAAVEASHTVEGRYVEQMWNAWSRALLIERRGQRRVNMLTGR